ncbi:MAG: VWA domain-containing protein [Vicinamibacterales bacterium]
MSALTAAVASTLASGRSLTAQESQPTFRTGVAVVPINAVVRDARNRIVRNLTPSDFHVYERGVRRPIVEFRAHDDAPISVAFLFDTSGSMPVANNLQKGKALVGAFLAHVNRDIDQVALFTFDRTLRHQVPFTSNPDDVRRALSHVTAWGLTSLYDAIADTAGLVAERTGSSHAVVVITDGDDTSSTLSPADVTALASRIDVPVYVVAVVSPLDHPGRTTAVVPADADGALSRLAARTGGDLMYVSAPERADDAIRDLLTMLRQQYFLAIEAAATPGSYSLEVRTTRPGLTVRSRSAYVQGAGRSISED